MHHPGRFCIPGSQNLPGRERGNAYTMFEQLFKFTRINFAEGQLGLQAGNLVFVLGIILVILAVGFVVVYFITNLYTSNRDKAVSLGLRIPALLLLFLPLFEPVLVMPDVVPDENFVAVLVDVSESMNIPDGHFGESRSDDIRYLLGDEGGQIIQKLGEIFKTRLYTFSDVTERSDSTQFARFEGKETNLSQALDRILSDFKGVPLTGVVLLTDGSDNSTGVPLQKAEEFRSLGIPLHVVGLGMTAFDQEREILDVVVSRGVEETTGAEIDVKVRSWLSEDEPVAINIYKGEELVFSEPRQLKGGGKIDQFTLYYEPDEPGASEYTVTVTPARNERNTANNSLKTLIDMRKDTLRVLYLEGHPRRDFKFIKRALEDDQAIEFTSVSRTMTGKYYRQGIKSPDELAGGFQISEDELYRFKAIILGDVEASAFSLEQLQLLEKTVRVRGSGFLMLGGRSSFTEGDYWNTPVADLLPVELDPGRRMAVQPEFADLDLAPEERGFRFLPTSAGFESPILKFSPDPETNQALWSDMPGLTSINYLGAVKPGAVVLAEKGEDDFGSAEPLLVVQNYGKGRTAALATASTWRWQMLVDAEDNRHERFWRQLARWLTASAPDRVNIDTDDRPSAPGEELPVTVTVFTETFAPETSAIVRGYLTDPFGSQREIRFQQDLAEPGSYTTLLVPRDEGLYELEVTAEVNGETIGRDLKSLLVRPSNKEYYAATLKRAFLENLAHASDGFYYEPDEAQTIPDNLRGRRTSTSIFRAEYLWDMPFIFGLILVLLSIEWVYRRRKGLP